MRTDLYVLMALALSSCTGKGFLHQRYTHYAHAKHRAETNVPIVAPEEQEKISAIEKKEIFPAGPERETATGNIGESLVRKPHGEPVFPTKTISLPKTTQAKNTSLVRMSARHAATISTGDPFALLAFVIWFLIALFLLALVLALIGLIVLLASHVITGIVLLTIGLVGLAIWLICLA